MSSERRDPVWFVRSVWLGILVNVAFAVPALFVPEVLGRAAGFPVDTGTPWLPNVGMLLVEVSALHLPFVIDPVLLLPYAWLPVAVRGWAALVWLILALRMGGSLYLFFAADVGLALLQGLCLMKALATPSGSARGR